VDSEAPGNLLVRFERDPGCRADDAATQQPPQTHTAGQWRTVSKTEPVLGPPSGAYRPVCPSICSRRMSAWPACLAVSSTMCTRSHRSNRGSGVVSGLVQS
jgi:hypothetical protein